MKKLLLPLAFAALTAFAGQALSTGTVLLGGLEQQLNEHVSIAYAQGDGASAPTYTCLVANVLQHVDGVAGNTLTVSAEKGYTITKIQFYGWQANNKEYKSGDLVGPCQGNAVASTGTLSTNVYEDSSWTGDSRTIVFSFTDTSGLKSLNVTYEVGGEEEPETVENPVLTLVEDEYCFTMNMSCPTEGAKIYYTEDGSEPTAESTLYTAPVDVWMATTFKAIAVNGEAVSDVVTYEANPPFMLEGFSPLLDFDADVDVLVKGQMTVVYKNGSNVYVKDASGCYMLVYGKDTPAFVNGDQFDRLEGTFTHYADQPEITNPVFGEYTTGEAVAPALVDLDVLGANMMCHYVQVEGVQLTGVNGKNATLKLGEVEFAAYDKFGVENFVNALECTVTGFVAINNGNLQLLPTEIVVTKEEEPEPQPAGVATFDFNDFGTLNFGTPITKPSSGAGVQIEDNTLSAEGVVMSFAGTGNNGVRYWNTKDVTTLRMYATRTMTIAAPADYFVSKVEFTYAEGGLSLEDNQAGSYTSPVWEVVGEKQPTTVTFKATTKTFINKVVVTCEKIKGSVDNIAADANAPVEYYNLQGVRVENPANG
ncbi:MAG: chitobiase/beta-hexosaminidase C-terminal domain-containing protein, partial [Muribaculaceae bacterium]|nr:chitobiase/beta-hexosaminidase C-terminal domain-containing protein [Muribaculaceae bacterium]